MFVGPLRDRFRIDSVRGIAGLRESACIHLLQNAFAEKVVVGDGGGVDSVGNLA
jgi:hypothetical protein